MSAYDRAHIAIAEQDALRMQDWRERAAPGEPAPAPDPLPLAILAVAEALMPASAQAACPRIDVTSFDDAELGALVRSHVGSRDGSGAVLAFES